MPKQPMQLHLDDYKCVLPINADLWNGFSVDSHSEDATLALHFVST